MPIYNLIEYSSNYSETTESLWFFSKDEATDFNSDILQTLMILNLSSIRLNIRKYSCSRSKWNLKKCSNCCPIKIFK